MIESDVVLAEHVGPCGAGACKDMIRPGEPMQKAGGKWFHEECMPADEHPDEGPHPDQLGLDQDDDAGADWEHDWRNR